jgi:hypothetical protein
MGCWNEIEEIPQLGDPTDLEYEKHRSFQQQALPERHEKVRESGICSRVGDNNNCESKLYFYADNMDK